MSGLLLFTVFAANCLSRAAALGCALWLSVWILAHCARAVSLLACGMLIAIGAFHLIPEALEAGVSTASSLGTLVAAGAVFALVDVLLARFVGHTHSVNRVHAVPALLGGGFEVRTQVCTDRPARALPILVGSSCHNFVDGILVAAAFTSGLGPGIAITLAIFVHEVPQLIGQAAIFTRFGMSLKHTAFLLALASLVAPVGGIAGTVLFTVSDTLIPYAMLVSAAAFLFVAFFLLKEEFGRPALKRQDALYALLLIVLGAIASLVVLSIGHA